MEFWGLFLRQALLAMVICVLAKLMTFFSRYSRATRQDDDNRVIDVSCSEAASQHATPSPEHNASISRAETPALPESITTPTAPRDDEPLQQDDVPVPLEDAPVAPEDASTGLEDPPAAEQSTPLRQRRQSNRSPPLPPVQELLNLLQPLARPFYLIPQTLRVVSPVPVPLVAEAELLDTPLFEYMMDHPHIQRHIDDLVETARDHPDRDEFEGMLAKIVFAQDWMRFINLVTSNLMRQDLTYGLLRRGCDVAGIAFVHCIRDVLQHREPAEWFVILHGGQPWRPRAIAALLILLWPIEHQAEWDEPVAAAQRLSPILEAIERPRTPRPGSPIPFFEPLPEVEDSDSPHELQLSALADNDPDATPALTATPRPSAGSSPALPRDVPADGSPAQHEDFLPLPPPMLSLPPSEDINPPSPFLQPRQSYTPAAPWYLEPSHEDLDVPPLVRPLSPGIPSSPQFSADDFQRARNVMALIRRPVTISDREMLADILEYLTGFPDERLDREIDIPQTPSPELEIQGPEPDPRQEFENEDLDIVYQCPVTGEVIYGAGWRPSW